MSNTIKIITSIIFLMFLISCSSQIKSVEINGIDIPVELAITSEQKATGLMNRMNLTGGMLFVYDDEQQRTFWMKDTLIPLDIIFINEKNKITKIHHAIPCKEEPCAIYPGTAKYVLEVNVNITTTNNIKEGYLVSLVK